MTKIGGGLDPRFTQIPCPVLRTLVNEEAIQVGPEGQVDLDQLKAALKGIGASNFLTKVLAQGGAKASPVKPELLRDASRPELDIYRLRGSNLDHGGDTKILKDPSQRASDERLAALLSLSKDGKSLTLEDLALANRLNSKEDTAGLRDVGIGMAELAALLLVFGRRNEAGVKALRNQDVISLFRDAKLPEGFEPGDVGALDVVSAMAKMAFHRQFTVSGRAEAGYDHAIGRQRLLAEGALEGLRQGLCPAGQRPQVSPAVSPREVAELHQPRAE